MTIGQKIKLRREELNLSQDDLSRKLGITRQAVSKTESKDDEISVKTLRKYAKALNVSLDFLLEEKTCVSQ